MSPIVLLAILFGFYGQVIETANYINKPSERFTDVDVLQVYYNVMSVADCQDKCTNTPWVTCMGANYYNNNMCEVGDVKPEDLVADATVTGIQRFVEDVLGSPCIADLQCATPDSVCVGNPSSSCQCKPGFIQVGDICEPDLCSGAPCASSTVSCANVNGNQECICDNSVAATDLCSGCYQTVANAGFAGNADYFTQITAADKPRCMVECERRGTADCAAVMFDTAQQRCLFISQADIGGIGAGTLLVMYADRCITTTTVLPTTTTTEPPTTTTAPSTTTVTTTTITATPTGTPATGGTTPSTTTPATASTPQTAASPTSTSTSVSPTPSSIATGSASSTSSKNPSSASTLSAAPSPGQLSLTPGSTVSPSIKASVSTLSSFSISSTSVFTVSAPSTRTTTADDNKGNDEEDAEKGLERGEIIAIASGFAAALLLTCLLTSAAVCFQKRRDKLHRCRAEYCEQHQRYHHKKIHTVHETVIIEYA